VQHALPDSNGDDTGDLATPKVEAAARTLKERASRGDVSLERLALAAHLGHPAAALAVDSLGGGLPSMSELGDWFVPLADERRVTLRFLLSLCRPLLALWKASPYPSSTDDALDQVLRAAEQAVDGLPASRDELERLKERFDPLYEPLYGVFFAGGPPLSAVIESFSQLLHAAADVLDPAERRDALVAVTGIAQAAVVGTPGLAQGPFAEASREVARWLLDEA
jgi:hypothetical protein